MSEISKLYRRHLEDFQMDVASVVIVHLALMKLSPKKLAKYRAARKMGAEAHELAEALSLETGLYPSLEDVLTSIRYTDDPEFTARVDEHLRDGWRELAKDCKSWRDVMVALFPKNPASLPVPRPQIQSGLEPLVIAGLDMGKIQDSINLMVEKAGGAFSQMGAAPETYYPDQVDEPGWSPGLTEPDDYDEECEECLEYEREREVDAFTTKPGTIYIAPTGTPLDLPVWQELGAIEADGLTLKPEESDCGAPLVHDARPSTVCQAPGCKCGIPNCRGCARGDHWMEAR
jgi:hypothetical protein